jgi:hypothetical protein
MPVETVRPSHTTRRGRPTLREMILIAPWKDIRGGAGCQRLVS